MHVNMAMQSASDADALVASMMERFNRINAALAAEGLTEAAKRIREIESVIDSDLMQERLASFAPVAPGRDNRGRVIHTH